MRILQVFNRYLERGGEEASVGRIFDSLDLRHPIRQVSFSSENWTREPWPLKLLQPARMFWSPRSVREVREEVREFEPDVVLMHNVFPVGSLATYSALLDLGIPVVQYVHNFRPFSVNGYCWAEGRIADGGLHGNFWPEIRGASWQNSQLKTACYASVLRMGHRLGIWEQIDCWVAISDFMRDTFVQAGIDPRKIVTVRHCWDQVNDQPFPREGNKRLLFMGRLIEAKGLQALVDAWEKVEQSRDDGELVIAGGGPLEGWVRERCAAMKRMRFAGFIRGEQKHELIRSCDAVVVPSVWWEPLGLVVYEAYDFGRPVLAAASGGLTETVVAGETGWLHQAGNADQLAGQMEEVLDGPDEAARRGLAGRSWLEANTKVTDWVDSLDGVFRKVLRQHRAAGRRLREVEAMEVKFSGFGS